MAVFAHPDDEMSVGPLLARYAREGVKVQLVVATDGRYGTGQTDLKPGQELVDLRIQEANCAAAHLGIEKPIMLGYHDQLKLKEGFFGHVPYIQDLMKELDSLVSLIKPDAIITWGPDGGSTHMDHRLIGASISQVFLSKKWEKTRALYYVGTPASHIPSEEQKLLRGVRDEYLTTRISYLQQDVERTNLAFRCYKSQYSLEAMEKRERRWISKSDRIIYLRPLERANSITKNLF
ncbi:MAG: hypothetical protein DHS20C17_21250 [Cyclobacteriaceae bacterium]|nr:MAG: hypothetical protein DHS20C17_21250 [Cyclobacteriaceae bacterium]